MFDWPLPSCRPQAETEPSSSWVSFEEGMYEIGHQPSESFAYDNESPRHRTYLTPFKVQRQLTTNADYLAFVCDGGYRRPEFWLSAGWSTVNSERWEHPLYWHPNGDEWHEFTLAGLLPLDPQAPVTHLSYYEADAFARWSGARLPTEAEWETAAGSTAPPTAGAESLLDQHLTVHPCRWN